MLSQHELNVTVMLCNGGSIFGVTICGFVSMYNEIKGNNMVMLKS